MAEYVLDPTVPVRTVAQQPMAHLQFGAQSIMEHSEWYYSIGIVLAFVGFFALIWSIRARCGATTIAAWFVGALLIIPAIAMFGINWITIILLLVLFAAFVVMIIRLLLWLCICWTAYNKCLPKNDCDYPEKKPCPPYKEPCAPYKEPYCPPRKQPCEPCDPCGLKPSFTPIVPICTPYPKHDGGYDCPPRDQKYDPCYDPYYASQKQVRQPSPESQSRTATSRVRQSTGPIRAYNGDDVSAMDEPIPRQ